MTNYWPQILADFKAKREALDQVIATIERHFIVPTVADEPVARKRSARRQTKRRAKVPRAKRAKRQTGSFAVDDTILETLRTTNQSMKLGALAEAVGISMLRLRGRLHQLQQAGRVEITGKTAGRRVSLGRARAAKEGP